MMNRGEQFLCICLDKWGYLEEMIYKIGYEQLQDKFDIIGFNLLSIIFGNTISAHLNFLSYLNSAHCDLLKNRRHCCNLPSPMG